ncbi:hypothetical protein A7Q09_02785 [Methylacidiphilum sp. Yel]|nr:hypothetical protein A7Q09_02785 [Methylacidiphilum sp. Yel]
MWSKENEVPLGILGDLLKQRVPFLLSATIRRSGTAHLVDDHKLRTEREKLVPVTVGLDGVKILLPAQKNVRRGFGRAGSAARAVPLSMNGSPRVQGRTSRRVSLIRLCG